MHWKPLLILVIAAVALRFFSFFPSVLDHDESTYILIGKNLFSGDTYFIDSIDTKPIGIFLLYAFFHFVAGDSIFLIRLLAAVWVGLTAYGLFRVAGKVYGKNGGDSIGWAAGIIYLFLSSTWVFLGLSPNTELFFNLFTVLAVLLWYNDHAIWRFVLAGFMLGLGFVIKYVTLFDATAFGLFILWFAWRDKQPVFPLLLRLFALGAGMAIPFLAVIFYYYSIGRLETLWFYTFEVTGKYLVDKIWWKSVIFLFDFPLRFLPFTILAVYSFAERTPEERRFHSLLILWIILDLIVISLPGKLFLHYFIPLMLPLSLMAAGFFHPDKQKVQWLRRLPPRLKVAAVAGLGLLVAGIQVIELYNQPDQPRRIAEYLRPRLSPNDGIYTGNYHHILYLLLDKKSPTPYVHTSLLWDQHHVNALGVDLANEAEKILDQKPKFVLVRNYFPENALSKAIFARYEPMHTFENGVILLKEKQ